MATNISVVPRKATRPCGFWVRTGLSTFCISFFWLSTGHVVTTISDAEFSQAAFPVPLFLRNYVIFLPSLMPVPTTSPDWLLTYEWPGSGLIPLSSLLHLAHIKFGLHNPGASLNFRTVQPQNYDISTLLCISYEKLFVWPKGILHNFVGVEFRLFYFKCLRALPTCPSSPKTTMQEIGDPRGRFASLHQLFRVSRTH